MRTLRAVVATIPMLLVGGIAQAQQPATPPHPPGDGSGTGGATVGAGGATGTVTAPTPPPPGDDDDSVMTIKASRNMDMQQFAESSQQELTVAGAKTRYALNLFGDVQFGAASRSEGARRPDPSFAVGVFDMLFTANLEKNFSMTSEFSVRYEPNTPLAELERLHLRWKPNKYFFVEVGRFHTDLGFWNVAYHHGRYLQLTVDRPRTIALHGGLLPAHWVGAQTGLSAKVGGGTINLVGSVGTAREKQGAGGHTTTHGSAFTGVNAVHAKLEAQGYLHRDFRFGVSGVYDRIPQEEAFTRPGLPDQSIDEKVGNAYIAFPSVPFLFLSEAYIIQHELNSSARADVAGSKWRTFGAFALLGYQIGRFTPYVRGEYINSQVGAFFFDPFYIPEPKSSGPFPVALDLKEIVGGTRIDVSDWCSVKLEYQFTAGVGTRRPELPQPGIHTGIASWSFGI